MTDNGICQVSLLSANTTPTPIPAHGSGASSRPFWGNELPKCKGAPPVRGRRALQNLGVRWPRLLGGAPDGYKHCGPRTPAAWQRKKRVALQRLREGILDDDGDAE